MENAFETSDILEAQTETVPKSGAQVLCYIRFKTEWSFRPQLMRRASRMGAARFPSSGPEGNLCQRLSASLTSQPEKALLPLVF